MKNSKILISFITACALSTYAFGLDGTLSGGKQDQNSIYLLVQ